MLHPLEQFEIFLLFRGCPIPHTVQFFIFLIFFGCVYIIFFFFSNNLLIPTKFQLFFEKLYIFILDLIKENLGKDFLFFLNLLFTIFFFILFLNIFGMIPYVFTITSHLICTFSLSLALFIFLNLLGILKHGYIFLNLFLPAGAPLLLSPFLVIVEIISYFARVFSLAIRLFANLMAGHTLLKILAEFGTTMFVNLRLGFLGAVFPIIIIILVTGLELSIAVLQAYVFTVLFCIYLSDALNLH